MSLLFWIAAILVGLLAVVLLTPVDLSIHLERVDARSSHRFGIGWLFGLVETEVDSSRPDSRPEALAETAATTRRRAKRTGRRPHVRAMLRARGLARAGMRLVRRLAAAVQLRHASVWLRAGFEDPADTGLLCAAALPAIAMLPRAWSRRLDVAPDFTGEVLSYDVRGRIRVVPVRVIAPFILFGLSPATIRAIYLLVTGRIT